MKKLILFSVLLILTVIPVFSQTPTPTLEPTALVTPAPDSYIDIYIYDAVTGEPVADATVVVVALYGGYGGGGYTDEDGHFSSWYFGQSIDYVTVSKEGYETLTIDGMAMGSYELVPSDDPVTATVYFYPTDTTNTLYNLVFMDEGFPLEPVLFPVAVIGDFSFTNAVYVNSGSQLLAAYGFEITFDNSVVIVNTEEGTSGVSAGANGFVSAVNTETPGTVVISGFDVAGTGPGTDLEVCIIHWLAQTYEGSTDLELTVNVLVDEATEDIGDTSSIVTGSITITTVTCVIGDVNEDGSINIVDALLLAQYYVGLDPAGFVLDCADINCDGTINIIDALLVAQYFVGLISSFDC